MLNVRIVRLQVKQRDFERTKTRRICSHIFARPTTALIQSSINTSALNSEKFSKGNNTPFGPCRRPYIPAVLSKQLATQDPRYFDQNMLFIHAFNLVTPSIDAVLMAIPF